MRRKIYDDFFFLLLAFVFYGVIRLLSPFVGALMGALICVVTFHPMHHALQRRIHHRAVCAALSETIVILFFVIPIGLLLWITFSESAGLLDILHQGSSVFTQWRDGTVELPVSISHLTFLRSLGLGPASLKVHSIIILNRWLEYVAAMGEGLVGHVVLFAANIFVMLFALFFFFRDGDALYLYLENLIPLRQEHKKHLLLRMRDTVIAVVRGGLLTSLIQGIIATLGYLLMGVPTPFLLGAITSVMSLVPVLGTAGAWGPVVIYFLVKGAYLKAFFLLLWCSVAVAGWCDIVVRPYLVGQRAQVSVFALFFALLGGLEVWGAKGLILGPLLVALLPELMTIYKLRYLRKEEA